METKIILLSEDKSLSGWNGLLVLIPFLILLGISIFFAVKKEEGWGMAMTMMLGMCLMFYALFNSKYEGIEAVKSMCLLTGSASLMWIVMAIGLYFKWPGFPREGMDILPLLVIGILGSLTPTIISAIHLLKHSMS